MFEDARRLAQSGFNGAREGFDAHLADRGGKRDDRGDRCEGLKKGAQGLRAGFDGIDGFHNLADRSLRTHVGIFNRLVDGLKPLPDAEDAVEYIGFLWGVT